MFDIYRSDKFDKQEKKLLTKPEHRELSKFIAELSNNPLLGKPLTYDFLREKKIRGKRVYFLTYIELKVILLVNVSTKKAQQGTIDEIKNFLDRYRALAEKLSRLS